MCDIAGYSHSNGVQVSDILKYRYRDRHQHLVLFNVLLLLELENGGKLVIRKLYIMYVISDVDTLTTWQSQILNKVATLRTLKDKLRRVIYIM
jgi:hypothetical protein